MAAVIGNGYEKTNDIRAHSGSLNSHEGFDGRLSFGGSKKVGEVVRRRGVTRDRHGVIAGAANVRRQ